MNQTCHHCTAATPSINAEYGIRCAWNELTNIAEGLQGRCSLFNITPEEHEQALEAEE